MTKREFDKLKMAFVDGVIGAPYVAGANGPGEYDCLGLSRAAQLQVYGVEIPDVARPKDVHLSQHAIKWALGRHPEQVLWKLEREPFDGALVVMGNVVENNWHLGTYMVIGNLHLVLHTNDKTGVVHDDHHMLLANGYNAISYRRKVAYGTCGPQRDPVSGG